MERSATAYLSQVKVRLISSAAVRTFRILKQRTTPASGYLRVRLVLWNGDCVEAAEYSSRAMQG